MRRLNLTTSLTVRGDVSTGSLVYKGFDEPVVTQLDTTTPDVVVAEDGTFTLADPLEGDSAIARVHIEDAQGYWIEGPVTIIGDGTPVVVDPGPVASYANIGMNLCGITGYNGNYPFANVLANMYPWSRRATSGGSGAWSQNKGSLTADVATDQFTAVLLNPNISRLGWTNGTYRVFNPDGCQIAFGYGADSPGSYDSRTQFDIPLSPTGQQGVYMFVKGSLTGKVKVIQPGYYDGTGETATFTSVITDFYNNLTLGPLRFMDWTMASQNYEVEWVDRVTPDHISFSNAFTRRSPCVPWEYCIELANLLNRDAWICISPRASNDYINQLAALFASRLNSNLSVWIEVGNEIWNPGTPWCDGGQWVRYLHHTRKYAVANGVANTFTYPNHGFQENDRIVTFSTAENLNLGIPFDDNGGMQYSWVNNIGAEPYVHVIDPDTFSLRHPGDKTISIPVYDNQVNLLFCNRSEAGKEVNTSKWYAELAVRQWNAFDAAMGASRVKRLICGQSGNAGINQAELGYLDSTEAGARARTSYVGVAPYFNGHVYGARITKTSGTFTPNVWCNYSGGFFTIAVYAAGATPTLQEVIAGTGAISWQQSPTAPTTYANNANWTASGFTPITGLTNGTTYKVYVIGWEYSITPWMFSASVVAGASGTDFIWDTYANQSLRMARNAAKTQPSANIAVAGDTPLISYELGADFNYTGPAETKTWRDAYMESSECAAAIVQSLRIRAAGGVKMLCYFSDCGSGPFSLASHYADTSDARYVAMKALGGHVPIDNLLSIANINATKIEFDPGAYPHTVYTLPDDTLTYTIISGNSAGLFTMTDNVVELASGSGIDWTAPSNKTVTILATDGYLYAEFTVSVLLGYNWYEGDSKFAWSGITDSDPAAVNPIIGGTLALAGTPATVSDGMWKMGGAANYTSSAAGVSAGNMPWLVAAVIDRNNDASGFKAPVQVGNSSKVITFYTGGGGASGFTARFLQNGNTDVKFATPNAPSGKHVFWAFWDGTKVRAGYDQIENAAAAVTKDMSNGISQYVKIGDNTQMKIGAVQSVARTGMTITDALAIVAKMQTHHSIP